MIVLGIILVIMGCVFYWMALTSLPPLLPQKKENLHPKEETTKKVPSREVISKEMELDVGRTEVEVTFEDGYKMRSIVIGQFDNIMVYEEENLPYIKRSEQLVKESLLYTAPYTNAIYDVTVNPTEVHVGKIVHVKILETKSWIVKEKVLFSVLKKES